MRFKIASEVISKIIESFGYANLFPRECYEFYARITGRTLRVDDNDSRFRFAPPTSRLLSFKVETLALTFKLSSISHL